jgi:hypothetical protein
MCSTARSLAVIGILVMSLGSICAAQVDPETAQTISAGPWDSVWGQVRFEDVTIEADGTASFAGHWNGAFETGSIQSGVFNPATGELRFRYVQKSLNGTNAGAARLMLSQAGKRYILEGNYRHDSGRAGPWIMWRSICGFSSDYDLVTAAENGTYSGCIRACGDQGHFWFQGPIHGGHKYLAINSLGKSSLSAQTVANYLERHIEEIFPFEAKGIDGPTVAVGNRFTVTLELVFGEPGYSNVKCTYANDFQFTFETVPGEHILRGQITFGVLKDGCGELWLYQQGEGPPDEGAARALFNYVTARGLWEKMADNLKEAMESINEEEPR